MKKETKNRNDIWFWWVLGIGALIAAPRVYTAITSTLNFGGCQTMSPYLFVQRFSEAVIIAKAKGAKLNGLAAMAQAANETGWGSHVPEASGRCSNNLFGIKAGSSWNGSTITTQTNEQAADGTIYVTTAHWRVYPSWNECLVDYANIIQRNYPESAPHADAPDGDGDPNAWIAGLSAWATNSAYIVDVVSTGQSLAKYGGPNWPA